MTRVFTGASHRTRERPPAAPSGAPQIVVVRSIDELAEHRAELDHLAADSAETNVFYESILAESAVRSFGAGRRLELVLVYRPDPGAPQRPARLCGFFPFERPVATLVSFRHMHCFLCTPLVRRDDAERTVAAALDWLIDESGATLVELRSIAAEGVVHQLLVEQLHARRRTLWVRDWSTRAFFERAEDAEGYLRRAISGLALKEVRRKEKRLGEQGRLRWRELEPGEDVAPWLRGFLELEA